MKLKNKKTGEILELCCHRSGDFREKYDSLAELEREWEDAPEEPKEYWYIDSACEGDIDRNEIFDCEHCKRIDGFNKSIGNYFETEEEAEKAVERLRAWKRLKDYNVMFNLDFVKNKIDFTYSINNLTLDVLDGEERIFNNMKIIFGGEDE